MAAALDRVKAARALEALRNGVPNSDAVTVLGSWQQDVERSFDERLRDLRGAAGAPHQGAGILISGGFGTGKSHLLEHLKHRALSANFLCSHLVVSKETPLHDLGKMFLAAAESAELPAGSGGAITELSERLNSESDAYSQLERWANEEGSGVSPLFPASLHVHSNLNDEKELVAQVSGFWSGEPLPIPQLKQALRRCGSGSMFAVRPVRARQLAAERFAFVTRLAMGVGLAGWVILIDEVELVGRYGPIQRGRSYAELARWMGALDGPGYPGLVAVAAITDDFDIVLEEKGDLDNIGPKLLSKGTEEMDLLAKRAEIGMRLIQKEAMHLSPPTDEVLAKAHDRLRKVHSTAYDWDAPRVAIGERSLQRPMRAFVRRWINEWDLCRLHPGSPLDTREEDLSPSYAMAPELGEPAEERDGPYGVPRPL